MNFGKQLVKKYKQEEVVNYLCELALKSLVITAFIVLAISCATMAFQKNVGQAVASQNIEVSKPVNKTNTLYLMCSPNIKQSGAELKCL